MRTSGFVVTLVLAASCAGRKQADVAEPRAPESGPAAASSASAKSASSATPAGVDAERRADEGAYLFLYLPEQKRLAADRRGEWVAIAAGRVVTSKGSRVEPVKTMEEADAAARVAAPVAKHRFVFQIGEEGDVAWDLGGCELPHVLGTRFMALLERNDVAMKLSPSRPSIQVRLGDTMTELALPKDDNRMHVQPEVGPPGARGVATAAYCVSSGFGGMATMSSESAAGLELWEIPGVAKVDGVLRSGVCRRARARFAWPNTPLDFTVPVAIWPK